MSQQSSCALSTAGRHHPGMVGDIISERWAASNRNAGRHHVGILGGFARNPRPGRQTLVAAIRSPKRCGRISAVLDRPILQVGSCVARGRNACRLSHDAETRAGLHDDRNRRARGSGRSASAVRGTAAAAQRGLGGLETGDERTAIGALRSALSCLLSHGGYTHLRKQQSPVMRHFCQIAEPGGRVSSRGGTGSPQCLCRTPVSTVSTRYHPALRSQRPLPGASVRPRRQTLVAAHQHARFVPISDIDANRKAAMRSIQTLVEKWKP